jgi:asparagine synthase (glutamine-hydrolysing)
MCGIIGWINWLEDLREQQAIVARMNASLSHRGPDAEGQWISQRAALAHRRLCVIDPSGGVQPMVYQQEDQSIVLTYNGELYNFCELRRELEMRGHVFTTRSDTEVLLHAYLEWEAELVHHLNGIFAFGIWDERKQQLLLVRDHLGVKPLFYAQRQHHFLFASELKALLAHPQIKPQVKMAGLAEAFDYLLGHEPGSGLFADIYEVRPGHALLVSREKVRQIRYWSLRSQPHNDTLETTVETIQMLLADSVRRQVKADVPVVAMLSGGLDSSGIAALMCQEFAQEGKVLQTYSLDFAESEEHFSGSIFRPSRDEPWAQQVATHLGTQHQTVVCTTAELLEASLVPLFAQDRPTMGQLETSLYLFCKHMKQRATVALSGEAADEVFGGYPWFHNEEVLQAETFPWLVLRQAKHKNWQEQLLSQDLLRRVNPTEYIERNYREALAEVPCLPGEDIWDAKRRAQSYLNLTRFLPVLLDRKDRMSMATGFEVRVPFCDHRLVEYVWNIPWEMKCVDGIEKGLLRRALTGLLPEEVRMRQKSAYPVTRHPAYVQAIHSWLHAIMNDPNAPIRPFLNLSALQEIIDGTANGKRSASLYMGMERLVQVNAWLERYKVLVC